jgi:hypothetical protein
MTHIEAELQGWELWRRQCARNLMDCYGLGMQALMESPGDRKLEDLTRLMVDGMTTVRGAEDEKAFYIAAARLCRDCAAESEGRGMFRIYAGIFKEMGGDGPQDGPARREP